MGAVNGMKEDGKVDLSCVESEEMWIGTSYSLAAFLWQQVRKTLNTSKRFSDQNISKTLKLVSFELMCDVISKFFETQTELSHYVLSNLY
jgi:uncharacterized protein (DUF608 family)